MAKHFESIQHKLDWPSLAALIQSHFLTWSGAFPFQPFCADQNLPRWKFINNFGWSDVFYVTMQIISCSGRIEPFFHFLFLSLPMNFSPYSPSPDEDRGSRTKKQKQPIPGFSSYQASHPESFAEQGIFGASSSSHHNNPISGSVRVNKYETAVSIRVDIEAALCYCLGPMTGKLCGMMFRFIKTY